MALIKDAAIVLRRLDYSETSQVLVVFTRRHGQQRIIAKGVKRSTKKRAAIGIDLLEAGRMVFSRRPGKEDGLATLTDWHQEENFPLLRRDLATWYAAQYAAEVTAHLTEWHDPHPKLFDGLHALLHGLGNTDVLAALISYLWLMLTEIGLRPELGRCVNCSRAVGDADPLYFSAREGGAICRDCETAVVEKRRIHPATARRFSTGSPPKKNGDLAAFELLDYYLTETMSRPPKLSAPLRSALGPSR